MSQDEYPSDWGDRRMNVIQRDGYECQGCGISDSEAKKEYGQGLHAHHITPISEGGGHMLTNLVSLCQECHVNVHRTLPESPYEPIEPETCNKCGTEFLSYNRYASGYCSEACYIASEAKSLLNVINSDESICSTCYHSMRGTNTCENCGNWEPNENKQEERCGFKLNIGKVARMAVAMYDDRLNHNE